MGLGRIAQVLQKSKYLTHCRPGHSDDSTDIEAQSSTLNVPPREVVKQLEYTYDRGSYGHGPAQGALPPWQWPDVCESIRAC